MSLDVFAEVQNTERPVGRNGKFTNEFGPAIQALHDAWDKGQEKTLSYPLSRITDEGDYNETLEKVTARARRLVNEATTAVGLNDKISVQVRNGKTDPWVIVLWVTDKRKNNIGQAGDNPVPAVEKSAK
jgi:hypothetical protein